jgi:hypothetical protein
MKTKTVARTGQKQPNWGAIIKTLVNAGHEQADIAYTCGVAPVMICRLLSGERSTWALPWSMYTALEGLSKGTLQVQKRPKTDPRRR